MMCMCDVHANTCNLKHETCPQDLVEAITFTTEGTVDINKCASISLESHCEQKNHFNFR
jgi:hypothetical protein